MTAWICLVIYVDIIIVGKILIYFFFAGVKMWLRNAVGGVVLVT